MSTELDPTALDSIGSQRPALTEAEKLRNAKKASAAAVAATSLEWYDFFIYGTAAALVFPQLFFAGQGSVMAQITAFATLAIGFVFRPIGAVVSGHLGDRIGRKYVLVAAVTLMSVATALIGLVPVTGNWVAAMLLVLLRIAQGLAVGAQWGGAAVLAAEFAPARKRGLYGSFAQLGVPVGVLLANIVFLVITSVLTDDQFMSWGWRVPFLISILMLPIGYAIHKYLDETPAFQQMQAEVAEKKSHEPVAQKSPILEVLRKHWQTVLLAGLANVIGTVVFYLTITGALQYVTKLNGVPRDSALLVILATSVVQIVVTLGAASLSDRVGRIPVFTAGLIGMTVWAIPMWLLIENTSATNMAPFWIAIVVSGITMSLMTGTQSVLFAELFPAEVRTSGAALGYQLAGLIGGFAPMVMVMLVGTDPANAIRVGVAVLVVGVLGMISLLILRARYGTNHMAHE